MAGQAADWTGSSGPTLLQNHKHDTEKSWERIVSSVCSLGNWSLTTTLLTVSGILERDLHTKHTLHAHHIS